MVYGPIAGGLYGACQEVYPKQLEDDGLCSCGAPKAQDDWLCLGCRKSLDEYERQVAEEIAIYDAILFDDEDFDEDLSSCQCRYCPCTQLTRYAVCDDCAAGVHQG